jgi:tetratricopeptide (TPR) repeat protein
MGILPRHAIFALALLVVSPFVQAPGSGAQVQDNSDIDSWTSEHFRVASEAHRRNNLDVAAKEYQLILSRKPKFAEVYQNLGILYHQQRKYREAAKTLQTAVSLKPDLLEAQVFLGIDRYMMQDFKGAVGPLEKVLRLKPAERQAGLYVALTYLALDEPEKAAQQLRKTAAYFPEDVEIAYHRGEAYLKGVGLRMALLHEAGNESALSHWGLAISAEQKGDKVGTILEYLKALADEPNTAELYWRLAIALHKAGIRDLGAAALQRYSLLNPDWDRASLNFDRIASDPSGDGAVISEHKDSIRRLWESLPAVESKSAWPGVADEFVNGAVKKRLASAGGSDVEAALKLYTKGDYQGAAATIKGKLTPRSDDWVLAYLQARAYFLASDYDSAEEVFDEQLQPHLQLPSVALLRMEIESQLAVRYLGLVVAKDPNSYRAKLILAKSYGVAGRIEEAISTYQEVLRRAPDSLGIHLAIGQLYEDKLNWAAAIEELKAELALAPDNALALAHLGHAYTESQDADQAIPILTKLLAIHPDDGRAYADLGKAWTIKENPTKAIEAFERALAHDRTQHNLHYRLFQLYSKTGDGVRAKTHLVAFKAGEADRQQKQKAAMATVTTESNSNSR